MGREEEQREQCPRLIDLINHLPPGAHLTSTKDFEQMTGQACEHVGIVQACNLVLAVGYQDIQGIRESDGSIISIYGEGAWTPWPAFFVSVGEQERQNNIHEK